MLVAAAGVAMVSLSSANAADMPLKYQPVAQAWSWTGFYIGAHVGSGWGTVEAEIPGGGFALASGTANGFLGGGQIGFNWQSGPVVIGVEADASSTNLKGTAPCLIGILVCKSQVDWMSTFTGRVGFTADKSLVYVKGGGAWANFNSSASILGITLANADKGQWGATIGTGIEYAFAGNWSAKVEYDYLNFGKRTVGFTTIAGGNLNIDMTENVHVVKFGVNYRFGGVAASY
jgi:outer membrane immunogenic protein